MASGIRAVACCAIGVLNPRGHGVPTLRDTLRIRVSYDLLLVVDCMGLYELAINGDLTVFA